MALTPANARRQARVRRWAKNTLRCVTDSTFMPVRPSVYKKFAERLDKRSSDWSPSFAKVVSTGFTGNPVHNPPDNLPRELRYFEEKGFKIVHWNGEYVACPFILPPQFNS